MNSRTDPEFWRRYHRLPKRIQASAQQAYRQFQDDPFHTSLHFKPLRGHVDLWSVRVTGDYRAVAYRHRDDVLWFWIGSHAEFDAMF